MKSYSNTRSRHLLPVRILLATILLCIVAGGAWSVPEFQAPGDAVRSVSLRTRGASDLDKLDPELRVLHEQFTAGRGGPEGHSYTPAQLEYLFGIDADDKQPRLKVRVQLVPGAAAAALKGAGFQVIGGSDSYLLVSVVVQALGKLVKMDEVAAVDAMKAARNPKAPQRIKPTVKKGRSVLRGVNDLDLQGLTGEGVIVGIIDTGIDWRHEDFRKPNGMTRILYLWDMVDASYHESEGEIGQMAPMGIEAGDGSGDIYHYGTLYNDTAINKGLLGVDACRSVDLAGHGTACASVAAGNGLATAGLVEAGRYRGLAPEADLMICRAGDGSFGNEYIVAVQWIIETARRLGRPCVINLSLGGHFSAHDGHEAEEEFLNELIGAGIPGAVICASAGNEGRESFHAAVRYGASVEGQADIQSSPLEIYVKEETELHAYFDASDDWGLAIMGQDQFLVSDQGEMSISYIQKVDGVPDVLVPNSIPVENLIDWAQAIQFSAEGAGSERVAVPLPAGRYYAWAYGASGNVSQGKCDLYLPFTFQATFGSGTVKEAMVGTPGNADDLITVGSYDFRISWNNHEGTTTRYNMIEGGISDFSSPGFRRDGVVKPDIVAPGRFAISAAAEGSSMKNDAGESHITADGLHLAWEGTSASSPYVVGVVALMLQKNPSLDAAQVKEILIRTARSDRHTGAVPNPNWGHGKVNVEAALKATKSP